MRRLLLPRIALPRPALRVTGRPHRTDHPYNDGREQGSWRDLAESVTCELIALLALAWLGNLLFRLLLPAWPTLAVLLWLAHLNSSWLP
ncbi:hypothetical protein GCM10010442_49430 [Kitasatospora kifunensis]